MITISNLNKYYNKGKSNELHVINDTTITLEDTGLVCILGESGSGKTTLMNTISGLDNFMNGTIDVDGTKITKYGSKKQEQVRNEKFGYIFQNYYLLQDRTVEYNIMLSLSLYDIPDDDKEARINYVLKAVDMERYKNRLVSQLSGGQQQRIAIARALAKTPKVIFADEPTGNLDEANTMRIMSILKKISEECLVIVVTHEKSIAEFFADRILWISDGKIVNEKNNTVHGSYTYNDDTNIYLKEYEKTELGDPEHRIETYSSTQMPDFNIKIIYENERLYIYSDNNNSIEILSNDGERQVIDSERPKVEIEDVNMDYSLERLETAKIPKIGFKRTVMMAQSNLKSMGKKKIFLIVSLLVMSVLMVITIQDILTVMNVDTQEIVSTDSHYLQINATKNKMITDDEYDEAFNSMFKQIADSNLKMDYYICPTVFFSYDYTGFWQLENLEADIEGFSLVPIDEITNDDLAYGRMPENYNEIVIDKWVLEKFINQDNEIANVVTNVQHFLNKQISMTKSDLKLTIVGISETNEHSVYIDKVTGFGISTWATPVAKLSYLQKAYPGQYDKALNSDEVYVSESVYEDAKVSYFQTRYRNYYQYYLKELDELAAGKERDTDAISRIERRTQINITYLEFVELVENIDDLLFTYKSSYGVTYNIVGTYPDEFGVEFVINDDSTDAVNKAIAMSLKKFMVYCDDTDAIKDFFKNGLSDDVVSFVNISIADPYNTALDAYIADRDTRVSSRLIITITIFVVSMIILYFMMRANAIQRMTDLGVYRLLGISKGSIIGLFAFENIILTSYTSLIGIAITTFVLKFLGNVPSLNMSIIYPWYAILGTVVFIYLINIIIGITPIRKLLKLPPAQLASKYDI